MTERIASAGDPRVEPYRHVADPRWLREHDLFVAEGRLVVRRLFAAGGFDIVSLLLNRAAHDALRDELPPHLPCVYVCDDGVLAAITGFNFHRGCLGLVRRPAPRSLEVLLRARRLLALEGVGNPDNVGGLFRTAAAFGAGGVLLDRTSGDPLYRKAVRTSMGAVLQLPFARLEEWPAGLQRFRDGGFRVVALTPQGGAEPLADFARELAPGARVLVLVGAEGSGLHTGTLEWADARVRIPIEPVVDSLNVVVAAAIALERLR